MPEVEPQPEALRRTAAIGRDELAASETTPDRPAIGLHLDPLTTSVLVASPSSPTSSDAMISLASASALPPRPLPVASPSPDLLPAPPAADADGVRPMTMAPPASTDPGPGITIGGPLGGGTTNRILCDPYGNCTSDNPSGGGSGGSGGGDSGGSGGGDSGGSGGSGGGDPPPDDIEIDISGGWVHGYQDRVPVGAIVSFGFDTSQINGEIESVSWDGGTDVRSYFSDPGGAPAPKGFHVTTGVPKDQSGYSFIVDADARQYTIFVTVTLVDGRSDSDELTFTSVRPDVQLTHSIASQPRVVPQSPLPGTVSIKLDNPGGGNWPNNAGAKIDASTTTKEFPGSFMFMQLIKTQRFALNQNGIQISMPVQGAGPALDNSFPGYQGVFAYPIYNPQHYDGQPGSPFQWGLNPHETESHGMADSPYVAMSLTFSNLQVGRLNLNNPNPPIPEKYDTYLMCKPWDSGVWVALAKVHWEWGGLTNDGVTLIPHPKVSAPTVVNPVPKSEQFPGWTDTAALMFQRGTNGWVL